jgi:hypothetical protein
MHSAMVVRYKTQLWLPCLQRTCGYPIRSTVVPGTPKSMGSHIVKSHAVGSPTPLTSS